LTLSPNFTFKDFMKTPYYNGQSEMRMIYLGKKYIINGKEYYVSLFFEDGFLNVVNLTYADESISEEDEMKRKEIHDKILEENGIEVNKEYGWGKVVSSYDPKGNSSNIIIAYRHLMSI
jgi:hypothetical protein